MLAEWLNYYCLLVTITIVIASSLKYQANCW
jgi:hypothetical protein